MRYIKLLSIAVLLCGFTFATSAQTLQEATEAYNKASELKGSDDIVGAIAELEKCVDTSKKLGEEGEELLIKAESIIPSLYYENAGNILDKKDYQAALKAFDETIAAAEKYNDPDTKEKAQKPVPQIYYAMGMTAMQDKNYEEAIKNLNEAIVKDPDMAKAYYYIGAGYQILKDEARMEENFKLAIEKGNSGDDAATAKNAANQWGKFFYNKGITAMKTKKWDEAIAGFSKAVEVDNPLAGDAYHRLGSCYNNKKDWDKAVENCEKALELKAGADAKAVDGVYYELGTAYAGKKDTGNACSAFKKVTAEPYLAGAKYQIETALKCK